MLCQRYFNVSWNCGPSGNDGAAGRVGSGEIRHEESGALRAVAWQPREVHNRVSWGIPNSWMVDMGKSHGKSYENGWFGGSPVLGHLHIVHGSCI